MLRRLHPRQKRQQVEQEIGEQPPFLLRVGEHEDGIERELLGEEVRPRDERGEQDQHRHGDARTVSPNERLGDAQDGAGEAEAQHRE